MKQIFVSFDGEALDLTYDEGVTLLKKTSTWGSEWTVTDGGVETKVNTYPEVIDAIRAANAKATITINGYEFVITSECADDLVITESTSQFENDVRASFADLYDEIKSVKSKVTTCLALLRSM